MSENLPYSERLRLIKLGLLPKEAVAKKKQPIKKISDKKKAELEAEKKERGGEETELTKWYRRCVKMMSGYCVETGLKTETKIFKYAVMSIAHLIPKSKAKSVATHPLNWIELNVDFHHKFDAMSWEEREKLGCWPVIQERLIMIYPDLHPSERRHYPESVLRYMENQQPFWKTEDCIQVLDKTGKFTKKYKDFVERQSIQIQKKYGSQGDELIDNLI